MSVASKAALSRAGFTVTKVFVPSAPGGNAVVAWLLRSSIASRSSVNTADDSGTVLMALLAVWRRLMRNRAGAAATIGFAADTATWRAVLCAAL